MRTTNRLWTVLGIVFVLSFAALGWLGREIYLAAPPIPDAVKAASGETLFTSEQIRQGQQAWLAAGGQQLGTVWGHGSYVAPDWSADWLHREAMALRDLLSQTRYKSEYDSLAGDERAAIDARVQGDMRRNTYDPGTQILTLTPERVRAVAEVQAHYQALFGDAPEFMRLREQYAMPDEALPEPNDRRAIAAFFFWSAWSATTDRPGEHGLSYTSNWPHEPLVGNVLTDGSAMWTVVSIILLISGIAATIWWYSVHTQFGIFWIATAWLATGLYIAPLLSGKEPRYQKLGVDALFYALLLIVAGSTVCSWLGSLQKLGFHFSFWWGAQGLEYTNMGRIWQVLLFVGLLFWLFLLGRALWPALKRPSETRGLVAMVFLSATCIGAFYATSLTWGPNTHYSMIEYWRWWLVHLWVEGFFEVFATAVVALIFTRLALVSSESANRAIVAETIVFLFGGILGTLHHLYWTGTPTSVIAVGAVFSALEVVPLALLGLEGWHNYQRSKAAPWVAAYRWPILCFVAVGFWNTVGAGLLGFAINPPASLYYVQGLDLTPAHGHAALFGVYGMLGIGLMLFCLRGLFEASRHAYRLVAWMYCSMNIGLAMMVFLSLLPAGIYQAAASISHGLWYARSAEIVHSRVMETLVWLRVPGDIVFAAGGLMLAAYALRLLRRPRGVSLPPSVAVRTG